ncbi:MinD/ParA family protein [Terasakiella sp. A23]|uniref:MinD/ParA family protein n=1 Tax=Terasakiella sp. FCG-A23 TaxID=3080561 RepID=UPI0029533E1E|nr:MinD/ParA family protein [Terasakiella sp. A23]MDV7339003.1 MinD/ParA family protein [Terasakiella sp. A23]
MFAAIQKTTPAPTARKGGNVFAVASGKGGVGKTWFAVTLSHALADLGQRTLLFDGDFGLANVDIQLGLMPKCDLSGVIGGNLTLNQAVQPFDDAGYDIIAGRSGSSALNHIPANQVQHLGNDLGVLAASYDRVIIDLGAGLDRPTRQLTTKAGTCLVVTADEPTAMTDAYAFIKTMSKERPGLDLRIVVNQSDSIRDGERTYNTLRRACEGFLGISPPLAGVIRWDKRVRDTIKAQQPLLSLAPTCPAARDVVSIANSLLNNF